MRPWFTTLSIAICFGGLFSLTALGGQEEGKVTQDKPPQEVTRTRLAVIQGATLWREADSTAFYYRAKMAIDADGAPDAYHPEKGKARDDLSNAGAPGNWWALVTDNGKPDGTPLLQGEKDPAPGYYISTTALEDETRSPRDQRRFVDSVTIPYIVLPPTAIRAGRARLGDFVVVVNTHNHKQAYAIFADIGPDDLLGEGSIALANALGIPSDARVGGIRDGVIYLVFPHSGNGKPRTLREIHTKSEKLFQKWGGMNRLKQLVFESK